LREGKGLGFFRSSKWKGDSIEICLGGLTRVCKVSKIKSWGATADDISLVELLEGNNRRRIASAIATQDLQAKSYFAAKRQLSTLDKKSFEIPTVDEMLDGQTSLKMGCGGRHGVVHIGDSRIFMGRSFIPYGVSQDHVCEELNSQPHSCGVSSRTLRRHLDELGVTKRQVMQAKPEYREIYQQLNKGAREWKVSGDTNISYKSTERGGIIRLDEPAGISGTRREGGHIVDVKRLSRYFGATWLYRCNLYNLSYSLTSMKATRRKWKKEQAASNPVENSPQTFSPQTPEEEEVTSTAFEGAVEVNQNKEDKNDNEANVELEHIPDKKEEIPSVWEQMKQKLYQQQQQRKEAKKKSLETRSLDAIQEYWSKLKPNL
jgi:hypothetical protein